MEENKSIEILEALSLNGQRQYDYILKLIKDARQEGVEIARKEILDKYEETVFKIVRRWRLRNGLNIKDIFREFDKELKQSLEVKDE